MATKKDAETVAELVAAEGEAVVAAAEEPVKKTRTRKTAAKKAEDPAEEAAPKKAAAKKTTTAKKEAAPKKAATTRKTAAKKAAEPETTIYVQYAGLQIKAKDVLAAALASYQEKNPDAEIKTIEVYVKPEENAAYYVVNGEGSDDYKVEL